MSREFIAIIDFDEDAASRFNETNGYEDVAPGDMIEREFKQLEQSGITLENWALTDYEESWEQYIRYLANWAIEHSDPENKGLSPISYHNWCDLQN